jgi:hypothetical protein
MKQTWMGSNISVSNSCKPDLTASGLFLVRLKAGKGIRNSSKNMIKFYRAVDPPYCFGNQPHGRAGEALVS